MALLGWSKIKDIFVSYSPTFFLWGGTIIVIIITFILAYYKVRSGPSSVALHYNVIVGVDVLGNKSRLYIIPFTGLIVAIINASVLRLLSLHDKFLEIILAAGSLLANFILLGALLLLFRVN